MNIAQVRIQRVSNAIREYDTIRVWIDGKPFSRDLVCDSDITSAKRIADTSGVSFMYDEANAERVRRVLGISQAEAAPACA
jgi:hypothetical protein